MTIPVGENRIMQPQAQHTFVRERRMQVEYLVGTNSMNVTQ